MPLKLMLLVWFRTEQKVMKPTMVATIGWGQIVRMILPMIQVQQQARNEGMRKMCARSKNVL